MPFPSQLTRWGDPAAGTSRARSAGIGGAPWCCSTGGGAVGCIPLYPTPVTHRGGPGMRRFRIFLTWSVVALLMFVIVSEAQQGGGNRGGGFRFGFGGANLVGLLQRTDVTKELDVTDEQMEKLPDALMKAIA